MSWQTIETAPKDGTAILIYAPKAYFGDGVYLAWWGGEYWLYCTEGATDYPYSDSSATHWMPIPSPPSKDSQP